VSVDQTPPKTCGKKEKASLGQAPPLSSAEAVPAVQAPPLPRAEAVPAVQAPAPRDPVVSADATPEAFSLDAETIIPDGSDQRVASRIFINSVAPVLEHLCVMTSDRGPTSFDGVKPPPISLQQYIHRLYSFIPCSSHCFVYAVIYVDRVLRVNPQFKLSDLNVHRTFFTALVVASKFYDDEYYSNSWYGRVGGVGTKELNILEVSFLKLIQFRLTVSTQEYDMYLISVERACSAESDDGEERSKAPVAEVSGSSARSCAKASPASCAAEAERFAICDASCAIECS
jgi:hypothetical protein